MTYTKVEEDSREAAFIVFWVRHDPSGTEFGTHRAVLSLLDDEGMLVWGHYHRDLLSATDDYAERTGGKRV